MGATLRERLDQRIGSQIAGNPAAVEIWKNYEGSLPALHWLLDSTGVDDPVLALTKLQFGPETYLRGNERYEDQTQAPSEPTGQPVKHFRTFTIEDREDLGVMTIGMDVLERWINSWGSPALQEAITPEARIKKFRSRAPTSLDGFAASLEEILAGSDNLYSRLDRELVRQFQEYHTQIVDNGGELPDISDLFRDGATHDPLRIPGLHQGVVRYAKTLERLLFQQARMIPEYHAVTDVGGMLLTKFERAIQYNELPQRIRNDYLLVSDTLAEHPQEKIDAAMRRLTAYAAVTFKFSSKVLEPYKADLCFIEQNNLHPVIDRFIDEFGRPSVDPSLLDKKEVSAVEAMQIIDAYPLDTLRHLVNTYHAQTDSGREAFAALSALEGLFIEDGRLDEGSLKSRLSKGKLNERYASLVLTDKELRAAQQLTSTNILVGRDRERFYGMHSMPDFNDAMEDLQVIGRKLNYLTAVTQHAATDIIKEEDKIRLAHLNGSILRKDTYALAEQFEQKHGLTIDDFLARGNFALKSQKTTPLTVVRFENAWYTLRDRLQETKDHGLYDADLDGRVASFIDKSWNLKKYVPISEVEGDLQMISNAAASPLARPDLPFKLRKILGDKPTFLSPEDVREANPVLGTAKAFSELSEEEVIRYQMLKEAGLDRIYTGTVADIGAVVRDRNSSPSLTNLLGLPPVDNIKAVVEASLGAVPAKDLPEEWRRKARYLASTEARLLFYDGEITPRRDDLTRLSYPSQTLYVAPSLVVDVDERYGVINGRIAERADLTIIATDKEEFRKLWPDRRYRFAITGTRAKDASSFKVRLQQRGSDGFRWNKSVQAWESQKLYSKLEIAHFSQRVADYNSNIGADLKIAIGP